MDVYAHVWACVCVGSYACVGVSVAGVDVDVRDQACGFVIECVCAGVRVRVHARGQGRSEHRCVVGECVEDTGKVVEALEGTAPAGHGEQDGAKGQEPGCCHLFQSPATLVPADQL